MYDRVDYTLYNDDMKKEENSNGMLGEIEARSHVECYNAENCLTCCNIPTITPT